MTWVYRAERAHCCDVPRATDGQLGDLWRCDACDRLWQIGYVRDAGLVRSKSPGWRPASWWQRFRYRRHGHRSVLDPDIWVTTENVKVTDAEWIKP